MIPGCGQTGRIRAVAGLIGGESARIAGRSSHMGIAAWFPERDPVLTAEVELPALGSS